jgi:hypothetical protein
MLQHQTLKPTAMHQTSNQLLMLQHPSNRTLKPTAMHQTSNLP